MASDSGQNRWNTLPPALNKTSVSWWEIWVDKTLTRKLFFLLWYEIQICPKNYACLLFLVFFLGGRGGESRHSVWYYGRCCCCHNYRVITFVLVILLKVMFDPCYFAGYLRTVWCPLTWKTTSGRWVRLAPVVPAQRSTTTGLGVEMLNTSLTWTIQTSWRSGILCSYSITGNLPSRSCDICKPLCIHPWKLCDGLGF